MILPTTRRDKRRHVRKEKCTRNITSVYPKRVGSACPKPPTPTEKVATCSAKQRKANTSKKPYSHADAMTTKKNR
jgi:hypothetical protein